MGRGQSVIGIGRPLDESFTQAFHQNVAEVWPDAVYMPRQRPGFILAEADKLGSRPDIVAGLSGDDPESFVRDELTAAMKAGKLCVSMVRAAHFQKHDIIRRFSSASRRESRPPEKSQRACRLILVLCSPETTDSIDMISERDSLKDYFGLQNKDSTTKLLVTLGQLRTAPSHDELRRFAQGLPTQVVLGKPGVLFGTNFAAKVRR